jgi:hypothetical protein
MRETRQYPPGDAPKLRAGRVRRAASARQVGGVDVKAVQEPHGRPVAIWDGKPKRSAAEHDHIYDER